MTIGRRPWREELEIIDRTMKAISGVTDPEELVNIYWENIDSLIPIHDYMSVSRRDVAPPDYIVTRSSRFTEEFNPWTQRDRLPRLRGGLAGEIAFANKPIIIDDLPARLSADDPARFYLEGFQSLVALPQYDNGEALNVTMLLFEAGRELDPAFIPMLHWQSGLFGRGTHNLVLRNRLADALRALDREVQIVGQIQRSLLPQALPDIPGFELAAHYQTSARAGGDYYDFFPLNGSGASGNGAGGGWGMFIADVSGHGTPAAVLMAITHALAHAPRRHYPDMSRRVSQGAPGGTHESPARLLSHLNNELTRSYTRDGTFVTAFYAVLDPSTHKLTYATAGHNPPRLARGGGAGSIVPLDASRALPLGIADDETFDEQTIELSPSDLLLLYTDGITETMAPRRPAAESRELFGVDRLDELLLSCRTTPARGCIDRILSELSLFCESAPPSDDQTLIAMRCL